MRFKLLGIKQNQIIVHTEFYCQAVTHNAVYIHTEHAHPSILSNYTYSSGQSSVLL